LVLFSAFWIFGQEQIQLIREIQFEGQNHTTDNLGNIYASNGPQLFRFNQEGQLTGEFRSVHPGNIAFVDASNPLQILLFYKEYNQVVFLDKNLTEKGVPLSLIHLGIENAELVCSSVKGGIWVLDWLNRRLNYYSHEFKLLHQTSLHGNLISGKDIPVMMNEFDGNLYVSFPVTGILVFDRAGTYRTTFPLGGVAEFQKRNNDLIFVKASEVLAFYPETNETVKFDMPLISDLRSARLVGNLVFAFKSKSIIIFRIG
jgi:hypothetical protein